MVLGLFLANKKQRSDQTDSSYSLMSKTIHRIDDDIVVGQHLGLEDLDLHSENRKSSHSIRYSKSCNDLKPVKITNPNKWFDIIELFKDTIFEFLPLSDLSNRVAKSCIQFKLMVTNFVGSRHAFWWSNQWLWTYFSNPYECVFYTRSLFSYASFHTTDRPRVINGRLKLKNRSGLDKDKESVIPDRVLIGYVDQHTEGSCKYKSFHAFKVPFEQIVEMYESKMKKNEYKTSQAEVHLIKDPVQFEVLQSNDPSSLLVSVRKLFSRKGILGDMVKSIKYSASGRGGVASGEFIKEINRQLSNVFEQEGDYRKTKVQPIAAPIFRSFREQLLTYFKTMIFGWWPLCFSGKLVVKRSKIVRRVVSKGTDISLPLFTSNIVKIVSIVYESKEKSPLTLCSFVYEKEVQN